MAVLSPSLLPSLPNADRHETQASESKGCLPRPIQIIRTTHSDNPYGGKGIIRMTQRDNPDTSKRLSERPKGAPPLTREAHNYNCYNVYFYECLRCYLSNSSSIVIGIGDISEYIFSLSPYVVTRLTCTPPLCPVSF